MQNKEIEKDKQHLRDLSEDALKCEDNELIGIDAYAVGSITRILQYIDQLENKVKEVKQQLKIEYEKLTESVKRYEDMRRNCKDEFYLKSYQTTIHKLNAKRETIRNIIDLLEK